jgi:O-antigen/teichoic acid export membrane protein
MIGYTTPLIQIFGNSILEAKGKYSFKAILNLIFLFLGVLLGIVLTRYNQTIGMIVGICICWIISQIIMNFYFIKVIKLEIGRFFIDTFARMIFAFPIIIALSYLLSFIQIDNWLFLGIKIGIYGIIYLVITYKFCMNQYEKSLLLSLVQKFNR